MKNSYLGMSGLHPWDIVSAHHLLRCMDGLYVYLYIDYNTWHNGMANLKAEDAPAFYDSVVALNSEYRQILRFSPIPLDKREEFVKMIAERYPNVWAIQPTSEIADVNEAAETIKAFREILPYSTRLAGPGHCTAYPVEYMDTLLKLGAIQCLDVITLHDYYACPGRGTAPKPPWDKMPYAHVNERGDYFPSMLERIKWVKEKYFPHLRNVYDHQLIYGEYGLYQNNPNDAKLAALVSRYTKVPLILSSPSSPIDNYPYSNGIYIKQDDGFYRGEWTEAMKVFLETMALPDDKINELIHLAREVPKKKRKWWQQILFKLFGMFKEI